MQQFGTSAFNTVVHWHKLGEVENEYTSEKHVLFAIFVRKIFTIGQTLTKFWQKISLQFFWDTVYMFVLFQAKYCTTWIWRKAIYSLNNCFGGMHMHCIVCEEFRVIQSRLFWYQLKARMWLYWWLVATLVVSYTILEIQWIKGLKLPVHSHLNLII